MVSFSGFTNLTFSTWIHPAAPGSSRPHYRQAKLGALRTSQECRKSIFYCATLIKFHHIKNCYSSDWWWFLTVIVTEHTSHSECVSQVSVQLDGVMITTLKPGGRRGNQISSESYGGLVRNQRLVWCRIHPDGGAKRKTLWSILGGPQIATENFH